MPSFRNHMHFRRGAKRRPWENPAQKRVRKKEERILIEGYLCLAALFPPGEAASKDGEPAQESISSVAADEIERAMDDKEEKARITVGMMPDFGDACLSGDPGQMIALGELSLPPSADNDKIPAAGPIEKESWAEFLGLRIYRLRKWFA